MPRTDAIRTKKVCIARGCRSRQHARGLCHRCYTLARRAIADGERSDAELVELQLMLPAAKRGPKATNATARALESIAKQGGKKR